MFYVKPVESKEEYRAALELVHEHYCDADLMNPEPSKLRLFERDLLPCSTTFVAIEDGKVIGTQTGNLLGLGDLPCWYLYKDIILDRFSQNEIIAETTKFACIPSRGFPGRGIGKLSHVGTELFRWLFYWCVAHEVTQWLIVIPPHILPLYQDDLGFKQIGPLRTCSHVNNKPGILFTLPVQELLADHSLATNPFKRYVLNRPLLAAECDEYFSISTAQRLDFPTMDLHAHSD